MTHPALVLFDIDGTLVRRAGPHHREALVHGIREASGLETSTDGIPVHGMLDPVIIEMMMRREGASLAQVRETMPEIVGAAERYYLQICPLLHEKHCPGVAPLLDLLKRRGILLGLVTGNLTRIAWRKLGQAGLAHYFRFGAFGEMAATRAGLVKIAVAEATAKRWIDRAAPIALVGDAPADVDAAQRNAVRSIAVATGLTPAPELRMRRPDILLRDLRELRLRMVLS